MSESHIRIGHDLMRNSEYIKFDKGVKSTLYRFLQAAIVRKSKEVKNYTYGAKYIYNEHYLKGRLVSRYSQKKLAEYLQTSQSRVNNWLKELEENGFIKILKIKTQYGKLCYYQLGTWTGEIGKEGSYHENIWLDEHFIELILENKTLQEKKKVEDDQKRLEEMFGDLYNDYDRAI